MQIIIDEALERVQNREEVEKEQIIHDLLYGDPSEFYKRVTAYDVEGVWVVISSETKAETELVTQRQLRVRRQAEVQKRKPFVNPQELNGKDILEIRNIFDNIKEQYKKKPFWPINWLEATIVAWPYTTISLDCFCQFGQYKVIPQGFNIYIQDKEYQMNPFELILLVSQLKGITEFPKDVQLVYQYGELYAEKNINIHPKYMIHKNEVYKLSEEVRNWMYVTAVRIPIKLKIGEAGECKAKGVHPQIWNPYLDNDDEWNSLCIGDFRKKHWRYVYDHIEEILKIANFDSCYQDTWYLDEEAEEDGIEEFSVDDLLKHGKPVGFATPEVRT